MGVRVYVVQENDYDWMPTDSVFSTREKAEAYLSETPSVWAKSTRKQLGYFITEFELDNPEYEEAT